MPLVRIELIKGRSETDLVAIGNAIHRALVECLNVPERDRFQVFTEHSPGRLFFVSGFPALGWSRCEPYPSGIVSRSLRSTPQVAFCMIRATSASSEPTGSCSCKCS